MASRVGLSPSAYILRQGFRKGLMGGNRSWLIVGGTVWGLRVLRQAMGRTDRVVATEILKPGQVLRLEALQPLSRSQRKLQASKSRR